MKIAPTSDILIAGVHSPAGVAVEVADATGKMLVAQRLAVLVKDAPATPAIQTAEAPAAPDTAAAPANKKRR